MEIGVEKVMFMDPILLYNIVFIIFIILRLIQ